MKKIISSKTYTCQKAFTLIELLIVIAVLGILAAAIITAINPVKRINQAKDSNIQGDIAQIANAMQTYLTAKGAGGKTYYPHRVIDLTPQGSPAEEELKSEPKNCNTNTAGGGIHTVAVSPSGCTTALQTCKDVAVGCELNDSNTSPKEAWCWKSSTGMAAKVVSLSACVP